MPIPIVRSYETQQGPSFGTSAPTPILASQGFPTGDVGIEYLQLTVNHALTVGTGSAPLTDGTHLLQDSIYVESDKHGPLVENVDGLGLARLDKFWYGTDPVQTAWAAASASYEASYQIPFAIPRAVNARRPHDTILDMKNARLSARVQHADLSKAMTVGTATNVPTNEWSGKHIVGLREEELPTFVPVLKLKKYAVSATGQLTIPMEFGGLVYLAIAISQRNSTTNAEISTVINPSGVIRLEANGYDAFAPIKLRELRGMQKLTSEMETYPTGWAFLDFFTDSGLLSRGVDTVGKSGNMNLMVDIATASTSLWVYTWVLKPLPPLAARIPAQLGQ